MEELDLRFEINLQRLCCIRIARIFWEKKKVREEIEKYFEFRDEDCNEDASNPLNWYHLSKRVLTFLKDLPISTKFKRLLKFVTHCLGMRIFHWIIYVIDELELDYSCATDIFWTYCGTIDEEKIFKVWVQKKKLEPTELFNVACFLCLKNYLIPLWEKFPGDVKKNNYLVNYPEAHDHLIAYWVKYIMDNFLSSLPEGDASAIEEMLLSQGYDPRSSITIPYILDNSINHDQQLAVKYFWCQLNDQQRVQNLLQLIEYTKNLMSEHDICEDFLRYFAFQVLIKEDVYIGMFYILDMLVSRWPWEEFFTSIFNRLLQSYENPDNRMKYDYRRKFCNLLRTVANMMTVEYYLYDSIDDGYYQLIFNDIWCKLPEELKGWMISGTKWLRQYDDLKIRSILFKLLCIGDFKSLRLIINHEGFMKGQFPLRNFIMTHVKLLFNGMQEDEFIGNQIFYLIHKFVDAIGLDDNERENLMAYFHES